MRVRSNIRNPYIPHPSYTNQQIPHPARNEPSSTRINLLPPKLNLPRHIYGLLGEGRSGEVDKVHLANQSLQGSEVQGVAGSVPAMSALVRQITTVAQGISNFQSLNQSTPSFTVLHRPTSSYVVLRRPTSSYVVLHPNPEEEQMPRSGHHHWARHLAHGNA